MKEQELAAAAKNPFGLTFIIYLPIIVINSLIPSQPLAGSTANLWLIGGIFVCSLIALGIRKYFIASKLRKAQ